MIIGRWGERLTAMGTTFLMPLALRVRPLPEVLRLCDRIPVRARRPQPPIVLVRRAHRWLAHGRGPWTSSCLTRSIALYAMLRQHGYEPQFAVGVAGREREFQAHAWVSLDGVPIMDSPLVERSYARVVSHGA